MKFIFGVLLTLYASGAWAMRCLQPWYEGLDFDVIEQKLRTERVTAPIVPLKEHLRKTGHGSEVESISYYVRLETISAVLKPEKYLWSSWGEVGNYAVARKVKNRLVPPSVIRSFRGYGRGSLQFYVEVPRYTSHDPALKHSDASRMPAKHRSDSITFRYMMGRWDNHEGNLLEDPLVTPVIIDNESVLDLQYGRYGDFPFLRRGNKNPTISPTSKSREFPLDDYREVQEGTEREFDFLFAPFMGKARVDSLYTRALTGKFGPNPLRYVIWGGYVWIYWSPRFQKPLQTDVYSQATLDAYRKLTEQDLRAILPEAFSAQHRQRILERRDDILSASVQPGVKIIP